MMRHVKRQAMPRAEILDNGLPNTWFSSAQMSREEARDLFDYRPDGRLFWRNREGRRRPEAGSEYYRKVMDFGPVWTLQLGSRSSVTRYMRRYLVWNWHFGGTDRVLLPINGDTLDDRIENIRLGGALPDVTAGPQAAVPPVSAGVTCPCCGQPVQVLSPNLIARAYQLPPQQEAILDRVWRGNGKPVTNDRFLDAMFADDVDGGPDGETGRKYLKTQLSLLRKTIRPSGVDIVAEGYQRGYKLVIGQPGALQEPVAPAPGRYWRDQRLGRRAIVTMDALAATRAELVPTIELAQRLKDAGLASTGPNIGTAIAELRSFGVDIRNIRGKGYRLSTSHRAEWLAGGAAVEQMEAAE